MSKLLWKHLKDYYAEQALHPQKKRQLMNDIIGKPKRAAFKLLALAATLLIGVLIPAYFLTTEPENLPTRVVEEIALNHNKNLDPDFVENNLLTLAKKMEKLDFALVMPQRLVGKNMTVVGARYCSIQGKLAAQLTLVDDQGRNYTLYETPLTAKLETLEPATYDKDGLRVELWKEKGLFLGLASL